jgi:hypothetical protein
MLEEFMKCPRLLAVLGFISAAFLTGCEIAGDIFQAGVWVE